MLLLIGSVAASMHGILPPYRNGETGDIDIIADPTSGRIFADRMGAREYMADRYIRDRWQIDASAGTVNEMFLILNAGSPIVTIDGVPVTLGCPLTVMIARCASIDHCGERNRNKALRDANHYQQLLPNELPPDFGALWNAISQQTS